MVVVSSRIGGTGQYALNKYNIFWKVFVAVRAAEVVHSLNLVLATDHPVLLGDALRAGARR